MNIDLARVTNDIIYKANEENMYLPPTKLLKLLYFLYGHYIQNTNEPLFPERFQAWEYGPVIPELYNRIKGKQNVNQLIEMPNGKCYLTNAYTDYGKTYFKVFNYVWSKYRVFSATTLSSLTHAPNSPWYITKKQLGNCSEIDPNLIRRYFNGEDISKG